jgi:hypothetical protein
MVKITTAPPLIEDEQPVYHKMNTFNNDYEERFFKQDFECGYTL